MYRQGAHGQRLKGQVTVVKGRQKSLITAGHPSQAHMAHAYKLCPGHQVVSQALVEKRCGHGAGRALTTEQGAQAPFRATGCLAR